MLHITRWIGSSVIVTVLTLGLLPASLPLAEAAYASPIRGAGGSGWADTILGKPDFSEITPNTVVGAKLFQPHSVIVDRSTPGDDKLYVYDGSNSRILGFHLHDCLAGSCSAALVIGQPSFTTSACNGDSGFQNYPVRAPTTSATLCGVPDSQLSVLESGSASSMYVSLRGDLYVTDSFNNRVLRYTAPFARAKNVGIAADEIWGQDSGTGQLCNKGHAADSTTLCLSPWSGNNNWTSGVDIDNAGNLWVTDAHNNRVLRFPSGSKTADLVLGQLDFSHLDPGKDLTRFDQFDGPAAVRVTPQGVYVADEGNNRVLLFKAPFSNGMSGRVFGANFSVPSGIDVDPQGRGVWVANRGNHTYDLWTEGEGKLSHLADALGNGAWWMLNNASGSLGVDSAGNYYVATPLGKWGNDVLMFPAAGRHDTPGRALFDGNGVFNLRDARGLGSGPIGFGVAIYEASGRNQSQLVVSDGSRLLFWNDVNSLSNGRPADGVISEVTNLLYGAPGGFFTGHIKASKTHLYVARGADQFPNPLCGTPATPSPCPPRVEVYDLPLTGTSSPTWFTLPLQTLDGQVLDFATPDERGNSAFWGLAPSKDDSFLWISESDNNTSPGSLSRWGNRVFRVREPLNPGVRRVDAVLGQQNSSGFACSSLASGLCNPGSLALDRPGNLWISDASLEAHGNFRLLEFDASVLPRNGTRTLFATPATKILPKLATWEPAFDSQNRMAIGYNPYFSNNPKGGWFVGIYNDPLGNSTTPDRFLNDYYSSAFAATYDAYDNLYVGDMDRGRVLIYHQPPPRVTVSPVNFYTPDPEVSSKTSLTFTTSGNCSNAGRVELHIAFLQEKPIGEVMAVASQAAIPGTYQASIGPLSPHQGAAHAFFLVFCQPQQPTVSGLDFIVGPPGNVAIVPIMFSRGTLPVVSGRSTLTLFSGNNCPNAARVDLTVFFPHESPIGEVNATPRQTTTPGTYEATIGPLSSHRGLAHAVFLVFCQPFQAPTVSELTFRVR